MERNEVRDCVRRRGDRIGTGGGAGGSGGAGGGGGACGGGSGGKGKLSKDIDALCLSIGFN